MSHRPSLVAALQQHHGYTCPPSVHTPNRELAIRVAAHGHPVAFPVHVLRPAVRSVVRHSLGGARRHFAPRRYAHHWEMIGRYQ
jgi:hypothetical protein